MPFFVWVLILVIGLPGLWVGAKLAKTKHINYWLPGYTSDLLQGKYRAAGESEHLIFLLPAPDLSTP